MESRHNGAGRSTRPGKLPERGVPQLHETTSNRRLDLALWCCAEKRERIDGAALCFD
jgi:hypothetical protein